MNTLIAISFIVYGLVLIWILNDGAKIRRDLARKTYRGEIADALLKLEKRCDSLQAQVNVASRAAEQARGVRQ